MSSLPPVAVGLVEDDPRFRSALLALVEGTPGFEVSFAAGSVEQALTSTPGRQPDVVLLDIHLPGMDGIDGLQPLSERFSDSAILMLTVFEDEDRIFRALCSGADGYLLKKTPPTRLLEHVGDAATGGAPMSPEIAARVVRLFRTLPQPEPLDSRLSPRETRFLALLSEGHSYASAATSLGVSVNTVRNHVRAIYDKLHVHSKSEAVAKALRAGLI